MDSKEILVIEDNKLNLKLVKILLRFGEFKVFDAHDAETGIELAKKRLPDLILMDIQLPGMDGLNATRIIRSDTLLKGIPIVALTSYAMQGDEERAISAGCSGYITKPIDTRAFLNIIGDFLEYDAKSSDD